jgi:hypothetical protein
MTNPRTDLAERYCEMSEKELIERWAEGNLTELAKDVMEAEFRERGIPLPATTPPAEHGEPVEPEKRVAFQTVARSMNQADIQILRARLEAEGIPAYVADEGMNRMISLYSVAFGGMRLLVPQEFAAEAREIIRLLRSGRFALREGDDVGG